MKLEEMTAEKAREFTNKSELANTLNKIITLAHNGDDYLLLNKPSAKLIKELEDLGYNIIELDRFNKKVTW